MTVFTSEIVVPTSGSGTYELTDQLTETVLASGIHEGLATLFCRHTSCSLIIMENADPSAMCDLEVFLDRLVPECHSDYTHTAEGPDDMPSHIKMALTRTSETIPVVHGRLQLGTWQGVFLWEHRRNRHERYIVISIVGRQSNR